jgi:ABC-type transport system substrate-binding protein
MGMRNDDQSRGVRRRDLLTWGGGALTALTALSLPGCSLLSTDPTGKSGKGGGAGGPRTKQAPDLAARAKAGKLPPLGQRLPKKPRVIKPVEKLGTYGGDWRTALLGPGDTAWAYRTVGYEQLVNWDPGWTKPIPNIAESVETDPTGAEFTFRLRAGMKWSDGKPFTADDIVFAYDDVYMNKELNPQPPTWLVTNGEPGKVTKVDDATVKFVFNAPNGLFLANIAQPAGEGLTNKPRHYLEQFHKKYTPDVAKLAKKQKFDDWVDLFGAMADPWNHAGLPRITGWVVKDPLGTGSRMVVERNPYYWKVDTEGSQLPYIDRVIFNVINNEETMVLKAVNGELDMQERTINTPQNKPVLAAGRDKGEFHFVPETGSSMNNLIIALNLTHKNAALREVFQNRDFRIGLSHAINRKEMISAVFQRQGRPWQAAPRPESDYHDEEFGTQYTEYDVALANKLLDRTGYKRGANGARLGPDGKPIAFQVDVAVPSNLWTDGMELVRKYWQEVGVNIRVNGIDRTLMYDRKTANSQDANVWGGDGGLADGILDPRWYFPFSGESNYAIPWANWFNNTAPKQKPPSAALQQMELYRELMITPDADGRDEIFRQILKIAKEQFYAIGTVLPPKGYAIVRNNFHNVPKSLFNAWMYPGPGPTMPEQYFIS